MTTGDHIGGCSMLRHSPGPAFGCRSIGSLAANLTTQFMELEGPRYHYRPLFSIATERVVCILCWLLFYHFCPTSILRAVLQMNWSVRFPSIFFLHFLWPPNRAAIIFCRCGFFFLFSSPFVSGRRLDIYHTSRHDVALV